MSERREGWYWVKAPNPYGPSTWLPCHHFDGTWSFGEECIYPEQIGSRIPTPDEPWQCVPKEPTNIERIIANSALNDREEVAIQSFLVDYNTHPNPEEFEASGINGYFQWWRAQRSAAPKPEDV